MRVDARSRVDVGVAQALGDELKLHAGLQQHGGMGMAQCVERSSPELLPADLIEVSHPGGCKILSDAVRADIAAIAVELPCGQFALSLKTPHATEDIREGITYNDCPDRCPCFWHRLVDTSAAIIKHCGMDVDLFMLKVNILPLERQALALPHARVVG